MFLRLVKSLYSKSSSKNNSPTTVGKHRAVGSKPDNLTEAEWAARRKRCDAAIDKIIAEQNKKEELIKFEIAEKKAREEERKRISIIDSNLELSSLSPLKLEELRLRHISRKPQETHEQVKSFTNNEWGIETIETPDGKKWRLRLHEIANATENAQKNMAEEQKSRYNNHSPERLEAIRRKDAKAGSDSRETLWSSGRLSGCSGRLGCQCTTCK